MPIVLVIKKRCFLMVRLILHFQRLLEESLVKRCMNSEFQGIRKRGRQAKRWQDVIREETGLPKQWYVRDRVRWREKVNKWAKPIQRCVDS